MHHGMLSDETIAIGWVLLAVLNAFIAVAERGLTRFVYGFFCIMCLVLTFAFGYGAFVHAASR